VPRENQTVPAESWWKRRVVAPIGRQLTQGATPSRLASALAVGGVIAVNPFLGTTTIGCIAAGVVFRLNQPVLQIANVLGAPFQLALIVPWVRGGECLYRAEPMPIAPIQIVEEFRDGPWRFLQHFGLTALHAVSAWLIAAPLLGFSLYLTLQPLLRALGRRFPQHQAR